ncbi:MAG: hypothetical protein JXB60_03665 [Candidatus Cloacimonetes bacterium]|nr:hypothetical protein [Candidatus Cloacimonadota bacterium]
MKILGIRRETKNKWERRVPLNPEGVRVLVKKGYRVMVQPSPIRIYTDSEYEKAGAEIRMNLSQSDLIIGVKEVPVNEVEPGIPHMFFSHTIKGQSFNMPLLQRFLDTRSTLLDYELIKNDEGSRLVFFGKYAGNAGIVDTLWGLGRRLAERYQLVTPFLKVKRAHEYGTVTEAKRQLHEIGREIAQHGLPSEIIPFNIFLMGYGHVAEGCRDILSVFPIEEIKPEDLADTVYNPSSKKLNLVNFKEEHMAARKDGSPFDIMDYYSHGTLYRSKVAESIHYCSIYINAIFWPPGYPVFISREDLLKLQRDRQKLIIIGDITCDINGSVVATVKASEPDNPVYIYNAISGTAEEGFDKEGFANCAVDNFPCEFSREASDFFTRVLLPFMDDLLHGDFSKPITAAGLPPQLVKACIAHQGKLQPQFEYLTKYL